MPKYEVVVVCQTVPKNCVLKHQSGSSTQIIPNSVRQGMIFFFSSPKIDKKSHENILLQIESRHSSSLNTRTRSKWSSQLTSGARSPCSSAASSPRSAPAIPKARARRRIEPRALQSSARSEQERRLFYPYVARKQQPLVQGGIAAGVVFMGRRAVACRSGYSYVSRAEGVKDTAPAPPLPLLFLFR